jgi:SAM-dependent methyltransferase
MVDAAAGAACPVCGGEHIRMFYALDRVPAHSCLMLSTKEAARKCATGDIRLGFCAGCGFISNYGFGVMEGVYGQDYEATQGFSPTFSRYVDDLARRLVEDFGLRGKRILEIGCGKGQFIVAMCEAGMSGGIGIDPSYVPGRMNSEALAKIEFIADFYDERYGDLEADVICCRHTLEHIARPREMVQLAADHARGGPGRLVFFDVPDTRRVLLEGAFWDIYHEHCSYFTGVSLGALFSAAGLQVEKVWREYDEQYLLLVASSRKGHGAVAPAMEREVAELMGMVEKFSARCGRAVGQWKARIGGLARASQRVVLWGSGSKAVAFLNTLRLEEEIEWVVDINPHREGKFLAGTGQQIVAPGFLKDYRPDVVVVMNPVYREEIVRQLGSMGLSPQVMCVDEVG